jgi:HD-GYP domain-containing protein (c-di-GMP phosphodiesterase class II)
LTPLRLAFAVIHFLAAAVLAAALWWFADYGTPWGPIWVMAGLALVMGLLPIRLSGTSVHITLELPFVAGLAILGGPVAAIVGDACASLLSSFAVAWRRKERLAYKLIAANASICAISAGAAAIAVFPVGQAAGLPGWRWGLAGVLFALVYSASNFILVTQLDSALHRHPFHENVLSKLRAGGLLFLVGGLSSGLVALLAGQSHWALAPVVLAPLLATRAALVHKARLFEQYDETMVALMLMLHRAHPYTHGHLHRVSLLTERVGLELGLSPRRARMLREAAVLHDIGKIAIDERVLQKPGPLSEAEFEHVRHHAQFGAQILAHGRQFAPMVAWVLSHHERPDGRGYPSGLADAAIPIESKIIAVADAFDAMVGGPESAERRPYRTPMTVDEALAELRRFSGTQFDARVVEAFALVIARQGGY